MVRCCRAALNLCALDGRGPKTKMLIVSSNEHSFAPTLAHLTTGTFTAALLDCELLIRLIHYPLQSPTGAGDGGVYTPRSLQHKTLIFMLADKGNYF